MNPDASTTTFSLEHSTPGLGRRMLVAYSPQGLAEGRAKMLSGAAPALLGRGESSAVPLETTDGRLSRQHCSVEPSGLGWRLRDASSRNGTYHNAQPASELELQPNDVVRIGDHLLIYQELGAEEARALLLQRADGSSLQGNSPALAALRHRVAALAPLSHSVLILGETGVGKELVARELHGPRTGAPFVAINCAALPRSVAEDELFGHAKGAFTDAAHARQGLFREAAGGTLFLDELGELPLALQATLLRALDTHEVRPVGSDKSVAYDARIIAATNRDLALEIERGGFRSDLFARLMTHQIVVPPLRQHKDDILPMLAWFLEAAGVRPAPRPTPDAAEALLAYSWPRNLRELRQLATRLSANAELGSSIGLEHLPPELCAPLAARRSSKSPPALDIPAALLEIPRDRVPSEAELLAVFAALGRNVTRVADFFGKDRRQVYRWCERFGIDPSE